MNAKEFRIGNIVFFTDFPVKNKFIALKRENLYLENWVEFFCDPIPLTEDWLIKFGFKYNSDKGYCSDEAKRKIYSLNGFDLSIEENGKIRLWIESGDSFYSRPGKVFDYVHRLQNYYFEKTDKELELK